MKATRLVAVIVATTIIVQASALRASAQTPNVVIQWNQTLQTLFVYIHGLIGYPEERPAQALILVPYIGIRG